MEGICSRKLKLSIAYPESKPLDYDRLAIFTETVSVLKMKHNITLATFRYNVKTLSSYPKFLNSFRAQDKHTANKYIRSVRYVGDKQYLFYFIDQLSD